MFRLLAMFVGFCVLTILVGIIGLKLLFALAFAVVGLCASLIAVLWPVLLPATVIALIVWGVRRHRRSARCYDPEARRYVDCTLSHFDRMERRIDHLEDILDDRR